MNESESEASRLVEGPKFTELALPDELKRALAEMGYERATPVQNAALKPVLEGKDLLVQARTGTGKTAAFGLPLLAGRLKPEPITQALILTPTRELALQVGNELERLAQHSKVGVTCVYGGAPMGRQLEQLAKNPAIVVGTPGRVLDHLERKSLDVSALRTFVLDECDEMLSMGFLPQITAIWDQLPKHQTLLFSATVPKTVIRIADTRLHNPEFIALSGDQVGALEIQHFVYLTQGNKLEALSSIIEIEKPESAIVFCNTRDETKHVAHHLQQAGFTSEWLNADLSQADREKVMKQTRAGKLRFLVCTDVAARGIDISHLTHVINYDFPDSSEQYVHRTGRTGRAGRMGTAISLVGPSAIGDLYYLRLKYNIQPIERHLPTREELKTRREADRLQLLAAELPNVGVRDEYNSLAKRLFTHERCEPLVAALLREHFRATQVRSNDVSTEGSSGPAQDEEATEVRAAASENNTRLPRTGRRGRTRETGAPPPRPERKEPRRRAVREGGFRYEVSDPSDVDDSDEPDHATTPEESIESNQHPTPEEQEGVSTTDPDAQGDKSQFVNLYLSVGRRDGASLEILKEVLTRAGVQQDSTGRIAIRQRHSFVEVHPDAQDQVIEELNGSTICGREAVVEVARPRAL